jgi:chondroitin AC lyase
VDGLLRGNTARIREVVSRVSGEILAYAGEGIQSDLSFQQHNFGGKRNYYSGHYGLILAQDTAQVMRWAAGTDFAFGNVAVDQELRFLLDHLQWLTRGDAFDVASMGRMVTYPNQHANAPLMLQDALADMLPLDRRADELWSAIDRYNFGVTDANALSGNKSLWRSDAAIHERPEMLTTLRMLSSRTLRPETAAGSNTRGYFEGDGFTLFLQDGDELGSLGGQDVVQVWDWQRVPGTTVQHNGNIPYYDLFKTTTNASGSSNVVGSVSDGTYGTALMDYRRGGVSLTAKKSWFFFDDEVVALGADIDDANAASPVYTSLNQVLLDGPVTVQDAAGRRTLDLGGSDSLSGLSWIQHDNLGYVNLDPTSRLTVQAKTQSGGGASLPVFSAWVDHGARPLNKTYAYAVVPGVSPDDLGAYAANSPISILSNTATVQAVRHAGLGMTQVAFFAAGATWINDTTWVAVNQPALLMIREVNGDLQITAADPRQSAASLTIDVNRRLIGPGTSWQAATQATRISFALPADRGSSVTRTYAAMQGEPVQFAPVADAYVRGGTYANANYGTTTSMPVQNYTTGYLQEGLVRFETGAIEGEIFYAEVRLLAVGGTMPVTVAAAPVADDAWSETGVTWNTKPASGAEIGRVSVKQGQYATFDVTNLVREAAASDGQLSLRLYGPTYGYYSVGLGSRENANVAARPVLEVYVKPPAPPAEGESLAQHLALADFVPTQVIGPLRLSDALALAKLNTIIGPVLPPAAAAPPPPAASTRISRGRTTPSWDPAAVDLALDEFAEPDFENGVTI